MKTLKEWFTIGFKGCIMGIANIIPGVSGGTLAVILNIYEKFINALSSLFKEFKNNILFLIPLLLGMGVGIIGGSVVVKKGLQLYPLATILLFVGMIIGGMPLLFKKINKSIKNPSNYLIFFLVFAIFLVYPLFAKGTAVIITSLRWFDYPVLFVVGVVGSATMLMPGVSGSLTLMALGYYDLIVLECIGNIMDFSKLLFHIQVLIPFGLGVVVGLLLVAKLINFLLRRFEIKTYFAIFGFIFSSLIIIFVKNLGGYSQTGISLAVEIIVGIVLLIFGFSLSYSIANGGVYIGIWKINKK